MSNPWVYGYPEEGLRFRVADFLKKVTALLILFWIFRGPLRLEAYLEYIVWAIIGLIFACELLSVGKWLGVSLSGVIFALAKAFLWVSVLLFVGSRWIGLPESLSGEKAFLTAGTAFAYFIVLSIAGLLVGSTPFRSSSSKWFTVEKKAYSFSGADFGDVRLSGSGKAYPVRAGRKTVGWVIDREVEVEAGTPLGKVRKLLSPPVVVWTSRKLGGAKEEADHAFVERVQAMLDPDRLYRGKERAKIVDLGVIKVYEGDGFQYVKLPFIEVVETPHGERVKVGPVSVHEGKPVSPPEDMVTIRELGNGFQLTKAGDRLAIETEEYSIEVVGESVTYRSGEEALRLSGDYVSLKAGELSITVGKKGAKLRIEDTVITASDGKVKIRVGGKSYTIESQEACQRVMERAKEIVEEQSAELIEGFGVDRAALNARVKELIEQLMAYLG
ncbi:hypothetical protein [Thermococcus waiotapuensis]|uniref:Uncharacterized protein n=1 Tax=Thermococcus waiotapuensis TaxID=90909 RepID=A0AAE4NTR3_9EURY|nr:hypothetical protein [Thermococcus waiotapuensis]MDV3103694.1 hypothetical protein [Thermococcus waiotapuensis]